MPGALLRLTGATEYLLMPAHGVFALGVGHTRRKSLEPGDHGRRSGHHDDHHRRGISPRRNGTSCSPSKKNSPPLKSDPTRGSPRRTAGIPLERFCQIAEALNAKKVIGRFSTFLEHVKPSATGERVTRFNGLFHWAVPTGREIEAGGEVGRHDCMTHCYWREGGPQFGNVNIMGVVHGTEKARVLEHKAAIDRHLEAVGIPVSYTNVFWGGRSEIKPSEISPEGLCRVACQPRGRKTRGDFSKIQKICMNVRRVRDDMWPNPCRRRFYPLETPRSAPPSPPTATLALA